MATAPRGVGGGAGAGPAHRGEGPVARPDADTRSCTAARPGADTGYPPPTERTVQLNAQVQQELPFSNTQDFEDARRGFIGTEPDLTITDKDGNVVWSLKPYQFIQGREAPPTVNPSLWRQAQLNMQNGLFKVTDGIYQVRGYDLSVMTIIEGKTGTLVVDPLITAETGRAAYALYEKHRGQRPVRAVIYTHSHVDHYGGVKGVVSEADVKAGKVRILAPENFLEYAVSENVYAGNAMNRRSVYMYGPLLDRGPEGQVDAGLGKTISSRGTVTLIPPTDTIRETGDKRTLDGVELVFLMAPNTEAPTEMMFYLPKKKALCAAEDATHTLHNLYTLRGAEVRSAMNWWKYLNEAIDTYGAKAEVVFSSHHWPVWGRERLVPYLEKQRDAYKFLNDQALHLMNQGYTMNEVAETLKLPDSLSHEWFLRGYYGSVNHDAKAVYQKYLGWYDSNPAHLHPLPPEQAARRYVEFMGGAQLVMDKARNAYAQGDYRWVAEVMNHVIFADPDNTQARHLQADALDQLGYQTENATWRNEYLTGAFELRHGVPRTPHAQSASPDTLRALPTDMYLDYLGIRLNARKALGQELGFHLRFTDTRENYALTLQNSVLVYSTRKQLPRPDATLTLTRTVLDDINLKKLTFDEAVSSGKIKVQGDVRKFKALMEMLDDFDPSFDIVTPGKPLPGQAPMGVGGAGGQQP
ncbi:alkyl/aryl-sulfatase [Cystobacter fuscus]